MMSFAKKLGAAGELVGAEGLGRPDQAKRVRAGDDGKPITDGVFPRVEGVPGRLLDHRRRQPGARLPDRRRGVGCARPRRQTAEHGDRGAAGDERAAPDMV
jgi:hypothetical protein